MLQSSRDRRDPYHRQIDSAPAFSSKGTWASDESSRRDAPSEADGKPTLRAIDAGLFPMVLLQEAQVNATTKTAQIRLSRSSPAYWRITFDNPPLNVMGPQFVHEFREIMAAIEDDEQVKVVVFDSAVEGFFLNHSDFLANFEDLKRIPPGPTGLEAWPDILVRLTRAPGVSIASVRGRATGNGSESALACDMTFVSREKAVLSQWEVGVGLVAGGGPMARLARPIARGRALEGARRHEDI